VFTGRAYAQSRAPSTRIRAALFRGICAGILLGCLCLRASSQNRPIRLPIVEGAGLRFAHLSFGEGPSHSRVGHIVEDDQGFLRFGTQDGLRRYDGYRLREYRNDPVQYLDCYDPRTEVFTHFGAGQFDGAVSHIAQDREGTIWLATTRGLTRLDPATGRITRYLHEALPDHVRASLESALVALDTGAVGCALDRISTYDPELASTLRRLAETRRYAALLRLVEATRSDP